MVSLVLLKWRRNIFCQMLLLLVQMLALLPQTRAAPSLNSEQLDTGVVSFFFVLFLFLDPICLLNKGSEVFLLYTIAFLFYCKNKPRSLLSYLGFSWTSSIKRARAVFLQILALNVNIAPLQSNSRDRAPELHIHSWEVLIKIRFSSGFLDKTFTLISALINEVSFWSNLKKLNSLYFCHILNSILKTIIINLVNIVMSFKIITEVAFYDYHHWLTVLMKCLCQLK